MKGVKLILKLSLVVTLLLNTFSVVLAKQSEPYPLEYWALREVVNNVSLSPNGKSLALMANRTKTGNPLLEIYDSSDLTKKPYVLGGKTMEITRYNWISNDDMVVFFRAKVRDKIEGFNQGAYENKIAHFSLKKKKIKEFKESNPFIANLLPNKPGKVILAFQPSGVTGSQVDPRFRPRNYYEFNLTNGRKKLLFRGNITVGQVSFDKDGKRDFARGFDRSSGYQLWYVRDNKKNEWVEVFRLHEDSFETFAIEGFDINPNTILVSAHNGKNTIGLWSYDYVKKSFVESVYGRDDVDVAGVRYHSNSWTNPDTIVGVIYGTDKYRTEYFDKNEGAMYAQLDKLIPNAHSVRIVSRAREGQTMVIRNTGPRDPGTYYLLKDGKLKTVGSRQPLLKSEDLADVTYINYKARDGVQLHGFLTTPNSKGPHPLIVLPHGGPFIHENVTYDEWAQMLANNGYMVLQPEYRGSLGFGLKFNQLSFIKGGEGGFKMQDDKDDGALHLISKGLVSADRVAMFGWSYGGYAALVAAARTPQIYQCVIAGAAVADPLLQVNYYRDRLRGSQRVRQLAYREDSISPIDVVDKVNVPMLIIHGSVDQRVPLIHADLYRAQLDKYNKPYTYVELEGADHFSSTLFFRHQIKLYESLTGFLKNDCGPGGL